jgi:hypothetical protein
MIRGTRREFKRRSNVLIFQVRIISKYFRARRSSRQHVENILHPNTQPANARPAPALLRVNRYTI